MSRLDPWFLRLHRMRLGFVEERTVTYNRLRGLMAEFGIVLTAESHGATLEHWRVLEGLAETVISRLDP